MLLVSDNVVAESLVKEIGFRRTGKGTTAAGLAAIAELQSALCLGDAGRMTDGSGLSVKDVRSAREWRILLQAVRDEAWAKPLVQGLPVAGRGGTLAGRFVGTPAQDRVRAKTGTINGTRSLSGYATTVSGRQAVFSIVVNGPNVARANDAIDDLVVALVTKGLARRPPRAGASSRPGERGPDVLLELAHPRDLVADELAHDDVGDAEVGDLVQALDAALGRAGDGAPAGQVLPQPVPVEQPLVGVGGAGLGVVAGIGTRP